MEPWRKCWREGFAPALPTEGLLALQQGILDNDPFLIQGATTNPPPMQCVLDLPAESACAVAYCGWKTGLTTVGEVEEFFARACFEADKSLQEAAGSRFWLNYWDEQPRDLVIVELLEEVRLELARRGVTQNANAV